jgi:hypothetical protein
MTLRLSPSLVPSLFVPRLPPRAFSPAALTYSYLPLTGLSVRTYVSYATGLQSLCIYCVCLEYTLIVLIWMKVTHGTRVL